MPLKKSFHTKDIIIEIADNVLGGLSEKSSVIVSKNKEDISIFGNIRAKNDDKSGSIIVCIQIGNESNIVMRNFLSADRSTGTGIFSMRIKAISGKYLFNADHAWIKDFHTYPEIGFSSSEILWHIECLELEEVI